MNEFDFIDKYLRNKQVNHDPRLFLGIGDDAATLKVSDQTYLHLSSDMLLENKHFFEFDLPEHIAYKSLAVNLSDMAAMGATPKWVLLSLALPELDEKWLVPFFKTFFEVIEHNNITLIGGDTTRGPLTINLTIIGETTKRAGLQRNQAKPGDDIWVTGQVGLSCAALYHHWGKVVLTEREFINCEQARVKPKFRFNFMSTVAPLVHAAQDISDGLLQDLGHILNSSEVGARLQTDLIPTFNSLTRFSESVQWKLNGGDDYEVIFTALPDNHDEIYTLAMENNTQLTKIGMITESRECILFNHQNQIMHSNMKGFDHFEK